MSTMIEVLRCALTATREELTDLQERVRHMFEVHARPCEPNGDWRHCAEYAAAEDAVRLAVGLAPKVRE